MELDDDLCLCFHITRRKVVNFLRVEKPQAVSQLSECGGAGTGCGWCRPFLQQLFDQSKAADSDAKAADGSASVTGPDLPSVSEYAERRSKYIDDGNGSPPK